MFGNLIPSPPPMGRLLPELLTYKVINFEYSLDYIVTASKVESINESLIFYRYNEVILAIPSKSTIAYKQPIE